jgi:hypothetical protein
MRSHEAVFMHFAFRIKKQSALTRFRITNGVNLSQKNRGVGGWANKK